MTTLFRLWIAWLLILVLFVGLGPLVVGFIVEAIRTVSGGHPIRSFRSFVTFEVLWADFLAKPIELIS